MRLRWRWRRLRCRLRRSPRHRHRVSHEFQNDVNGIGSGAAVTNLAKLHQSPVERRESTQWATCGRAGHLCCDKECGDGAESTRVPLAQRTLFTFYSHTANLTGGRTIAITRLWLRLRLATPATVYNPKYAFHSQFHCASFLYNTPFPINFSLYLPPALPTTATLLLNQSQLTLQLLFRRPLPTPTASSSCVRINRSKRCIERGITLHTGLQLTKSQWNS